MKLNPFVFLVASNRTIFSDFRAVMSLVERCVKVRQSRKQIMVSSILLKNERWDNFQYIKLSQRSFFGRFEDTINCFWDLLTFRKVEISFILALHCNIKIHFFSNTETSGRNQCPPNKVLRWTLFIWYLSLFVAS